MPAPPPVARTGPWARWPRGAVADRQHLLALGFLVPVMLAAATWSYLLGFDEWRFDLMQAADRAGLYLFFVSPAYAAVAAWSARRARVDLGELGGSLPAPSLVWRRAWLPHATVGMAFHTVVLACTTVTAAGSGAVGSVDPFPVLVQFLSIGFFCAVGAVAGGLFSSDLAAPGLFVGLLALNTVLVQYGFRRISDVGTGSADFVDLRMNPAYLAPKALLFVSLPVCCLPVRCLAVGRRRLVQAVARLATGGLALVVGLNPAEPQQYVPSRPACHVRDAVQICVPHALAGRAHDLDAPVAKAIGTLERMGLHHPARVEAISRGATRVRSGSMAFSLLVPDLEDPAKLQRQVNLGFTYPLHCEDPRSLTMPPPNVLEARATLEGWLARRTDAALPDAAYPSDVVDRLLALPDQVQFATLAPVFRAVWSCAPDAKAPPG